MRLRQLYTAIPSQLLRRDNRFPLCSKRCSNKQRPDGIVNYTQRDIEHHVGVNIYSNAASQIKELSYLSIFIGFVALM